MVHRGGSSRSFGSSLVVTLSVTVFGIVGGTICGATLTILVLVLRAGSRSLSGYAWSRGSSVWRRSRISWSGRSRSRGRLTRGGSRCRCRIFKMWKSDNLVVCALSIEVVRLQTRCFYHMNSSNATSESRCESSGCTDCADELLRLCVYRYSLSVDVGMGHDTKNPCSTSLPGTTGVSYLRDSIFSYVCWSELRRPDCHYCSDQNGGLS